MWKKNQDKRQVKGEKNIDEIAKLYKNNFKQNKKVNNFKMQIKFHNFIRKNIL